MERVALLLAVLAIGGCSYRDTVRPDPLVDLAPESAVLGPEAFQFCGGWVELWARAARGKGPEIFIKASPPPGNGWGILNGSVVVEAKDSAGQLVRFTELKSVRVSGGQSRVNSWVLTTPPADDQGGLKVALQPFEGCAAGQEIRGVVLKSQLDPVTRVGVNP